MRNKKKKIGLIALFSCMFVASVAFAAFSGVLTINGTVDVMANPFKMIFTNSEGTQVTSIPVTDVDGDVETSDLTVSAEGTEISNFNVKLYKNGDTATYVFKIKNTGGSTAYLQNIDFAGNAMPTGKNSSPLTGLLYSINIVNGEGNVFKAESTDGEKVTVIPDGNSSKKYISVAANSTVDCSLTVRATADTLFNTDTNETITLGAAKINWTSVDPSTT